MMEYTFKGQTDKGNEAFAREIREITNSRLDCCYQCFTCTVGCPVVFAMDYPPHQIIRMVQMGLKERVLRSSTIWVCAACETCATRCPNEVEIVRVMDALREMALKEKVIVREPAVTAMHRIFLSLIKEMGRVHEISLLILLKLKTKEFSKDMILGMKMFLKGKLKIVPHRIKGRKDVKRIYQAIEGRR
jgi:heterodisulfide reductase subunit C